MDCNSQIHNDLINDGELMCQFCEKQLMNVKKVEELCCIMPDKMIINGMNTCVNCGLVDGCNYVQEYFDFYENMYKIRRKSVYHRKYHIDNVLNNIYYENNIQLTYHQREQIYKVFVEIDSVLNEVNDGRKRMISVKYVIKKLFKMLGLPYKDINVTKSKRTLTYYKQYWKKVRLLIGDRIQSIINV